MDKNGFKGSASVYMVNDFSRNYLCAKQTLNLKFFMNAFLFATCICWEKVFL